MRFAPDLLTGLGVSPVLGDLIHADLVDQVQFTPTAEYAFRHPLIRTVAYESLLRSDRADLHRKLAAAIERRNPGSDDNASQIAEHLAAAEDWHEAFDWYMRAGTWLTNRDIAAARTSWKHAIDVADRLPADDDDSCWRWPVNRQSEAATLSVIHPSMFRWLLITWQPGTSKRPSLRRDHSSIR
jgi:adenylate cyclase